MSTETETLNYKFNILERLQKFTPEKKKRIIKEVAHKTHRSFSTVKRVVYYKMDSQTAIDYEILKAFAEFFTINIEKLEN